MALNKRTKYIIPFFPTQKQFHQTCLPQEFSLPLPIMKYIWTNPSSPAVYRKLIQCCKLFFIKNPISIIHSLKYLYTNNWEQCPGNKCNGSQCEYYRYEKIDIEKIKNKIWLTKELDSFVSGGTLSKAVSDLIPKIYRFNLETLELHLQKLTFNELKFLSTNVIHCDLNCCLVQYDNGIQVPLETIIKLFSNCKIFHISFSSRYHNTAGCKSYDELIAACKTIKKIKFSNFPVDFNVSDFYLCLTNTKIRTLIEIYADNHSSRYTKIIDKILQTESFDFVPPAIYTHVHGSNKFRQMCRIQEKVTAKYL